MFKSFPSTPLRTLAVALVRYASRGLRPSWARLMEGEVLNISGGLEALIWAVGCLWALRVERFIRRPRPVLNCTLLIIGLYVTARYLLAHLSWYGMAPAQSDLEVPPRGLLKFLVFLSVLGIVALSTPGDRSRRVFGALAFPFCGVLGLLSVALAFQFVKFLMSPRADLGAQIILCGPIFGVIVAAALSLPCTLLYRVTAIPVAALALIPAISKDIGLTVQGGPDTHPYVSLSEHLWPFVCSLAILSIFCDACRRWTTRPRGEDERGAF